MIRIKIERRTESTKPTWAELREWLVTTFFLGFSIGFLVLSVLMLTRDGITFTGSSGVFEAVGIVIAVGLVILGIDRLVRQFGAE